jgi:hypothetical protein
MTPKITVHGGPSYPIGVIPPSAPSPGPEVVPVPPSPVRPPSKAPKAEWEAYAASLGVNVEGLSKPKIIKAVDSLRL